MSNRQDIKLKNIWARRDVNVNPTIVVGDKSRGLSEREAANALLRTPLREAALEEEAARAEELASQGDSFEAAAIFEGIAEKLSAATHEVIGEFYAERAADLYAEGDRERAVRLYLKIVRARLERFDSRARFDTSRLYDLLPSDEQWIGNGLAARADWPEHQAEAVTSLREAWDRTQESDDELEWAQALVELLVTIGRFEEAVDVGDILRQRLPLTADAARVSIELDWLDAKTRMDGAIAVANEWKQLVALAEGFPRPQARIEAQIWQRRGIALGLEGATQNAVNAFLRAIEAWALEPGSEDQIREAFFSMEQMRARLGQFPMDTFAVRTFAARLQGGGATPVADADRLELQGLHARLDDRLPEARRTFWLSYGIHRSAGNFQGEQRLARLLGELHASAGRPVEALLFFVESGQEKKVEEVALNAGGDAVLACYEHVRAPWERAAVLAGLAKIGSTVSEKAAASIAERLIEEATPEPVSVVSPQPSSRARAALAAMACVLPDRNLPKACELLRSELHGVVNAEAAANALILLTETGRSDETMALAEAVAGDAQFARVSPAWLGERLEANPQAAAVLRKAALEGNDLSLEALALSGRVPLDEELQLFVDQSTRKWIEAQTREVTTTNGERRESFHMLNFAPSGIIGAHASSPVRQDLLDRLLELCTDEEEPERTRGSAALGIFNLAAGVEPERAEQAIKQLLPLARGEFSTSPIDQIEQAPTDPFSRFNISSPPILRASALVAAAALSRLLESLAQGLEVATQAALAEEQPELVQAGLESLALDARISAPGDLKSALRSPDAGVRIAGLRAIFERDPIQAAEVCTALSLDPSPGVRSLALTIARNADNASDLVGAFRDDPDAYLRTMARSV